MKRLGKFIKTGQRQKRQEPVFEHDISALDLALSPDDRTGGYVPPSLKSRSPSLKPQKKSRPKRIIPKLFYWSSVACIWVFVGSAGLIAYYASQLPPIDSLTVPKRPPNIAIVAQDGTLITNRGDTGGRAVSIRELPSYLPNAFIAIEDKRFRNHFGIDPIGIGRAVVANTTSRGVSQGGSTLTQQLAKNLFLTQERTISRKIQEAILALWLERTYTKDQILELYLNRVYFGAGAYGVEAASQRYFNKSARQVTLGEAAILGGLVQAPSRLAPNRNLKAAQARAELVLSAMKDQNLISNNMQKAALSTPGRSIQGTSIGSANYAADYVMDVLDDYVGAVETDIIVQTSIDPQQQMVAEKALVDELDAKGDKFGVEQGALVALSPDGSVKALVGGRNYSESQFNRATSARRQPGSAFKPFVYLAALEKGLTPDSVRDDAPLSLKGWRPENYSKDYRGAVTLRDALALSLNTVAVRLGVEIGPKAVTRTAQRLGISSSLQANPSLALGTSEVTPLELAGAYAAFANGGVRVSPYVIVSVKTTSGKILYRHEALSQGRVIEADKLAMLNDMMHEAVQTGTARKADLPRWEAAGKTGTSQDFRDAWFVGYTGSLITAVWLGNDDGSPTKKMSGSSLPVDIWSRFMKSALVNTPSIPLPGGTVWGRSNIVAQDNSRDNARSTGSLPPRPPLSIQDERSTESGWITPSPDDRGFLDRLFGTR